MSQPDPRTFVPDAPHGTLAGYLTWNCGCMWCQAAQAAVTDSAGSNTPGSFSRQDDPR